MYSIFFGVVRRGTTAKYCVMRRGTGKYCAVWRGTTISDT